MKKEHTESNKSITYFLFTFVLENILDKIITLSFSSLELQQAIIFIRETKITT